MPVNIVAIAGVALIAGLAVLLTLLCRRVAAGNCKLPVTIEWMETLGVERYRPMLRLLDAEDHRFLKSQPGYRAEMAKRLRRQRCQIFYGYLRNLCSDFQRTCAALKLIMLHANVDRPDLASILLQAQAAFVWGLVQVHVRVALYRLGMAGVDVANLVKLFDAMHTELRTLVPAAETGF